MTMTPIISRGEWGAPPYTPVRIGPVNTVFVHHSVTYAYADLVATMHGLEAHARALGHRAIDYSFCHFIDGRRAEGRGWWSAGGHTLNNNSTSYGLCGIGNYVNDPVTEELLDAFAATIIEGIAKGAITAPVRIRPHSDVFPTQCPGRLREAIPLIAARVSNSPRPIPEEEDDEMPRLAKFNHAVEGVPVATGDMDTVYFLIAGTRRKVKSMDELNRIVIQHAGVGAVQSMTTDMKRFYPEATG